jgi:hypothetical protein
MGSKSQAFDLGLKHFKKLKPQIAAFLFKVFV